MKTIELTSIMGDFNHPNHNGRIYDSKMMEDAIKKFSQLVGKVELLDTPKGKVVEKLVNNHDFKLAPRMTGEAIPVLDDNGNQKFDENNNPIYKITNVNIESIDIIRKDW